MKKLTVTLTLLALAVLSAGCYNISWGADVEGSGVQASEARDLGPFVFIELVGSPDVDVMVGKPQSVIVEADDNIIEIIETRVRGRTLEIDSSESYSTRLGVVITITVPELEGVSVTGSGDVVIEGIEGDGFEASVTGSGDVRASGTVVEVEAEVIGSGDVDLGDLVAEEGWAKITGSGDITIHATEELTAKILGSGDIAYRGSPGKVDSEALGSGDISGS